MAIELITGHAGTPHISSVDEATINIGRWGTEAHWAGETPRIEMTSSNTLTIGKGVFYAEGRYYVISTPENITIPSGSAGARRKDGIHIRYKRDSSGIESAEVVNVLGDTRTPTTYPTAPYLYPTYSAVAGSVNVDYPIAAVTVNGTNMSATWMEMTQRKALQVSIPKTPIDTQYWWISYWASNGTATVSINSKGNGHIFDDTWSNVTINPANPLPPSIRPPHELWFPVVIENKTWYGDTTLTVDTNGFIKIANIGGNHGTRPQPLHATATWAVPVS